MANQGFNLAARVDIQTDRTGPLDNSNPGIHYRGVVGRASGNFNNHLFIAYQADALAAASVRLVTAIRRRRRREIPLGDVRRTYDEHYLFQADTLGGFRFTLGPGYVFQAGRGAMHIRTTIERGMRDFMGNRNARRAARDPDDEGSDTELDTITQIVAYCIFLPSAAGGCDSRIHTRIFADENSPSRIWTITAKTNNHNCGIGAIMNAAAALTQLRLIQRQEPPQALPFKSYKGARKYLLHQYKIPELVALAPVQLFAIAELCHLNLRVFNGSFSEDGSAVVLYEKKTEGIEDWVELVCWDSHYYRVVEDNEKLKSCPACHLQWTGYHLCSKRCNDCGLHVQHDHRCAKRAKKAPPPPPPPPPPPAPHIPPPLPAAPPVVPPMRSVPGIGATTIVIHDDDSIEAWGSDAVEGELRKLVDGSLQHILLHGGGGTGKSEFVKYLVKYAASRRKSVNVSVTSTTGISAIGINGTTIYRELGLDLRSMKLKKKPKADLLTKITELEILVVDEVSMLSATLIQAMDSLLRQVRTAKNHLPFGGVRLCLVGDVLQLPVVHGSSFYRAPIWYDIEPDLLVIPLTKFYRFTDEAWGEALRQIRIGLCDNETLRMLESRIMSSADIKAAEDAGLAMTFMSSKNKDVTKMNQKALDELPGDSSSFLIVCNDAVRPIDWQELQKKWPEVTIKIGSSVMMRLNHMMDDDGLANGSQGVVCSIRLGQKAEDAVIGVRFNAAKDRVINVAYTSIRTQVLVLPLQACHAISIHKSQGATLDAAVIDLGVSVFESGQAYVALSRLRTLDGLYLKKFSPLAIFVRSSPLLFEAWTKKRERVHFATRCRSPELDGGDMSYRLEAHPLANTYTLVSATIAPREFDDKDDKRDELLLVNLKTKGRKLLYHAIIFDFETYNSAMAGQHVVYGVQAKLVSFVYNVKTGKSSIEPFRWPANKLPTMFDRTLGLESSDMSESVSDAFFDWVMDHAMQLDAFYRGSAEKKARLKPIYLCAYNGNKFDLFWFARYLITSEKYASKVVSSLLTRGSSALISLSVYGLSNESRPILKTHDICDVLHMSLSQAVASYGGTGAMGKDCWPHFYLNDETISQVRDKHIVKVSLFDFPKSSRGTVQKMIDAGEIDLDHFDLFATYHSYLQKDIQALLDVYRGFDEICARYTLGAHVWEFSTMAQLTWYCFMITLENRFLTTSPDTRVRRDRGRILSKIYRLSKEDNEFVGQSIYGGCVFPRINSFTSSQADEKDYEKITDYLVDADICSMYVHVMMSSDYPYGEPRYAPSPLLETFGLMIALGRASELPFGIYEVEYRYHPLELHPAVPHRSSNGKLCWANCAYDSETGDYSTGKYIRSIVTNVDLMTIAKLCHAEMRPVVHKAFMWPYSGPIFKNWIGKTFQMKQDADVILQDPTSSLEQKAMAKALRSFGKLMGNACYGASAMRDFTSVYEFIRSQDEMKTFLSTHHWTDSINAERYSQGLDSILVVKGEPIVTEVNSMCSRPRFLGAFTLSYSRQLLAMIIRVVNPFVRSEANAVKALMNQPYYGDTDSVFIRAEGAKRLFKQGYFGTAPGKLTDDQFDGWNKNSQADGMPQFAKIIKAKFPAPKTYSSRAMLPDGTFSDTVRSKGIPSHKFNDIKITAGEHVYTKLDYDTMMALRDFAAAHSDESITVVASNRLARMGLNLSNKQRENLEQTYTIKSSQLERQMFKTDWSGRTFVALDENAGTITPISADDDQSIRRLTVPHGYGYKI
jgi:ATP-dependent DNA helicase PIF1